MPDLNGDYPQIEKAILFLERHFRDQPELSEVAQHVNLSEFHFQRIFRRWVGISPKRFVQFLTVEYAKKVLEESRSLLDATYDSGLSSPGRLHDLFVNLEAVTPGEYKLKGNGLTINYGFHASPFGECLLAVTERGICGLGFVGPGGRSRALADFKRRWSEAKYDERPHKTRPYIERIFDLARNHNTQPLTLLLVGTNFQIKVWQALLRIPPGMVVCYEDLARRVARPSAARAVGSAVAQNPISFLIPCHRVIRKLGITGDYHWGATRKKAMLAWEAARTHYGVE
ncbi:MAG TPA: bifunctional helix-turn-helix domain-containing protein/methylated-DNA--[protein]-cysteine S-methyltransferase [Terriglobia bacterium]|jgi:AraC family transcriptional regulator of adaptative response/methylated-DNA-[protein]-cysteine methyltransferase|nr:bifunctional helix-turn-helix domain-containing protein/methylated-DNA--[protein]-cysteine S-methyltransferase [Terriglobia bacterium]